MELKCLATFTEVLTFSADLQSGSDKFMIFEMFLDNMFFKIVTKWSWVEL